MNTLKRLLRKVKAPQLLVGLLLAKSIGGLLLPNPQSESLPAHRCGFGRRLGRRPGDRLQP